jgi:RNA polymerase sigma factor (sigma-70 family)
MALSRDALRLDRMRRGDDRAFERLHARHHAAVLAFCRHLTGSREDAEDAVQHTFLAAYRKIADGGEAPDWRPWLFTVARNRCLTLLRARRGESPLVDPDGAAAFDGLAVEVERREELRDLVRDMARLPERQRAALVLSQLDALSYREIGTVLDVTPEQVKALVFQARSALAAAREARDAPCTDIRQQIATARGSALRRRVLRRHVGQCEGCREFETIVRRQRQELGLLLPVVPAAGLAQSILASGVGREGAATASSGGAAVAASGGAGVVGGLTAVGAAGTLKLAVVVAVVGGSAAGALAADLPERVERSAPWHDDGRGGERAGRAGSGGDGEGPGFEGRPFAGTLGDPGARGESERRGAEPDAFALDGRRRPTDDARAGERIAGGDARDEGSGEGGVTDETPGASEPSPDRGRAREDRPPGLAKRGKLPPGLAKRDGAVPGRPGHGKPVDRPGANSGQGGAGGRGPGGGGGQANGGGQGRSGAGGQGNAGGPGGNGGAGGQGNAGGQGGNGGAGGQGNAGGQGTGGGGGQANGGVQGNGGSQGNGGGQGNSGSQGNTGSQGNSGGNGGSQGNGAAQGAGGSGGNAGGSPGQPR